MLRGAWSDVVLLLIAILATWRGASLVVFERGPFGFAIRARRFLVSRKADQLATCFHCVAVWMAILVVALIYVPSMHWLVLVPSIAAGASLLEIFGGGLHTGDSSGTHEREEA